MNILVLMCLSGCLIIIIIVKHIFSLNRQFINNYEFA